MLSQASVQRVEQSQGWRRNRMEMMELPEGHVVVKGQRPARGPLRFWLLQLIASCSRNPLLKPVPNRGGLAAQQTEERRLRTLHKAGVTVPQLLHVGADYLVMQRIEGHNLDHCMHSPDYAALDAFNMGANALMDLHAKGQYLSQGFARNMLNCQGHVFFIDFEDDPLQVMSLQQAQVRDWLSFVLSSVWGNHAPREQLMQSWTAITQRMPKDLFLAVQDAVQSLAWMRHLSQNRKACGRDMVMVQAAAAFLHQWNTEAAPLVGHTVH